MENSLKKEEGGTSIVRNSNHIKLTKQKKDTLMNQKQKELPAEFQANQYSSLGLMQTFLKQQTLLH